MVSDFKGWGGWRRAKNGFLQICMTTHHSLSINICIFSLVLTLKKIYKGLDNSARKPTLIQDTKHLVEKTYHIAPYLGAFGAYVMPQWSKYGSKGVSIYQNDRWNVAVNSRYIPSGQKASSFGQKRHQKTILGGGTKTWVLSKNLIFFLSLF